MLSSLSDIIRIIDAFTLYLEKEGCSFNGQGFPFFERSWFLEEEPDQMVTYRDRNNSYITQKDKTLLCFYCSDNLIYPRLERVFDELPEYKKYMGTVGADITVTEDMDIE